MLTRFELKLQLSVILDLFLLNRQEQILNVIFNQEGTAQYSHDFIDASVEFERSFNNSNRAVCDDSHINLYPNSILSISPKGFDAQVPLHPFEEGFNSPSVFIKECDILGFQIKVVRVVSESAFEFWFIVNDSPDFGGIVFYVPLCSKPLQCYL